MSDQNREGGLSAPTRHPLNQNDPAFWDEDSLNKELERVYDICQWFPLAWLCKIMHKHVNFT